ncbi:MAG: glycosyltransferase [Nitrospiria bacterium]
MEKKFKDMRNISCQVKVSKGYLDLCSKNTETVNLSFSPSVWEKECFLAIDIYSATNHVHPKGHAGWWAYPISRKEDVKVKISQEGNNFKVHFQNRGKKFDNWLNAHFKISDYSVFSVHVVLRNVENKSIEFEDVVFLYTDKNLIKNSLERRQAIETDLMNVTNTFRRWYCWPKSTSVHIVANDIREQDAIGNFSFDIYKFFKINNINCSLYAYNFDLSLRGTIKHVSELYQDVKEKDLIFFNFSIFFPHLESLVELPGKKILFYQNITPPKMFQVYDAEFATFCAKAYEQFEVIKKFDIFMANSETSGRELKKRLEEMQDIAVPPASLSQGFSKEQGEMPELIRKNRREVKVFTCPPLLNTKKWDMIERKEVGLPTTKTNILYVGRVAPHKKIEDLIFLFREFYKIDPDSSLLIAGKVSFPGYLNYLSHIMDNKTPEIRKNTHFLEGLSDGQLKTVYERSSVLVIMSEHEGFCIPIVEAMYFGKPVFAYTQDAVGETMGNSGRLFYDKDFETIAKEIKMVLENENEKERLISSQHARFREITEKADGRIIWEAVEKALFKNESTL